jgi:hypothetical protein
MTQCRVATRETLYERNFDAKARNPSRTAKPAQFRQQKLHWPECLRVKFTNVLITVSQGSRNDRVPCAPK